MLGTLKKTFTILELFLDINHENEFGLSEIAKLSGYNITTVNRIVASLVEQGYLRQPEKRGKYILGTKFFDFCGVIKFRYGLKDVADPYVNVLCQQLNEDVMLVKWDGENAIHITAATCQHLLRAMPPEGTKFSINDIINMSAGKLILAYMTDDGLDRFLAKHHFKKYTPNTIIGRKKFKAHIRNVRNLGIAFDNEEQEIGVSSVAAPIKDQDGKSVGSVGVLGPSARLTPEKIHEIIPSVKKCGLQISKALGYHSN